MMTMPRFFLLFKLFARATEYSPTAVLRRTLHNGSSKRMSRVAIYDARCAPVYAHGIVESFVELVRRDLDRHNLNNKIMTRITYKYS